MKTREMKEKAKHNFFILFLIMFFFGGGGSQANQQLGFRLQGR